MIVRPAVCLPLIGALCAAGFLMMKVRLNAALERCAAAEQEMEAAARDAAEVLALRARGERTAAGEKPTHDTLERVTAALAEAGIPGTRLRDLSREADSTAVPGGGPALRVQSMRVTLEPVTLLQLGRFLARWRSAQQLWTPTRIELAHTGPDDNPHGTYTVRIVISATYLADEAVRSDPSGAAP